MTVYLDISYFYFKNISWLYLLLLKLPGRIFYLILNKLMSSSITFPGFSLSYLQTKVFQSMEYIIVFLLLIWQYLLFRDWFAMAGYLFLKTAVYAHLSIEYCNCYCWDIYKLKLCLISYLVKKSVPPFIYKAEILWMFLFM